MKKCIIILFAVVLILSGCKNKKEAEIVNEVKKIDYVFKYDGKSYNLGEKFNINDYDEPSEYSEVASCAFEGLDKTYKYDHFELTTYPVNGEDKLYIVYFLDDEIKTNEGIKISDSFEDMINAYGNDYYQEVNLYSYIDGKRSIDFIVQNDVITSISYTYAVN